MTLHFTHNWDSSRAASQTLEQAVLDATSAPSDCGTSSGALESLEAEIVSIREFFAKLVPLLNLSDDQLKSLFDSHSWKLTQIER